MQVSGNASSLVIARLHNPTVVNGGWSPFAPCDCVTSLRTRTCSNPTPTNGGTACAGSTTEACSCTDQPAQFNTYPKGLDPLLQDGAYVWLAAPAMRDTPYPMNPHAGTCTNGSWSGWTGFLCADEWMYGANNNYAASEIANSNQLACKEWCECDEGCAAAVMYTASGNTCRKFTKCNTGYYAPGEVYIRPCRSNGAPYGDPSGEYPSQLMNSSCGPPPPPAVTCFYKGVHPPVWTWLRCPGSTIQSVIFASYGESAHRHFLMACLFALGVCVHSLFVLFQDYPQGRATTTGPRWPRTAATRTSLVRSRNL